MTEQKNFTEGKILVPLLKFAIPVLFALFLQSLYGAVDLMIVGKFANPADLSGIFAKDAEVIAASWDYLKAYAIDCMFTCFLFCFIGFFNGMEYTRFVMIQGVVGAFLVRIPVSYIMSKQEPVSLFHIGLATPCSTVTQIAMCFLCLLTLKRKLRRNMEEP